MAPSTPDRPPPGLEEVLTPCKETDPVASLTRRVRELEAEIVALKEDGFKGQGESRGTRGTSPGNILDLVYDELISRGRQGQPATVNSMADWAADMAEMAMQQWVDLGI
eukprot:5989239-Lingulodinium_polyedra.AAC.1